MGGSSFELLMQEIFNQKQSMDKLLEENHNLRHQLAELRAGRGIILEIHGQQFALNTEEAPASSQTSSPTQGAAVADQATLSMTRAEASISPISATPHLNSGQKEVFPDDQQVQVEPSELHAPTFLEEMLIDEFAAASTTQMPSWQGSQTRKLPAIDDIDEDQKAALRKQLIGSFLLE
ncbi:MAG: hypothetical protein NVS4B7_03500 [Ktedonobacteraceae bacterium]